MRARARPRCSRSSPWRVRRPSPRRSTRARAHARSRAGGSPSGRRACRTVDEAGDQLRVVRLLDEVELLAEMHLELVRERLDLQQLRRRRVSPRARARRAEHREVELDLLDDARPAHLDHDVAAAFQSSARCVCAIEAVASGSGSMLAKTSSPRSARIDAVDLRERHRRHLVDEMAELLDVHVRQQIRPRREQLAELDVRRAELLQRMRGSRCAPSRVASRCPTTPISARTRRMPLRRATRRRSARAELARGVRPRQRSSPRWPRRKRSSDGCRRPTGRSDRPSRRGPGTAHGRRRPGR